jgi:hypothetical protein
MVHELPVFLNVIGRELTFGFEKLEGQLCTLLFAFIVHAFYFDFTFHGYFRIWGQRSRGHEQ